MMHDKQTKTAVAVDDNAGDDDDDGQYLLLLLLLHFWVSPLL